MKKIVLTIITGLFTLVLATSCTNQDDSEKANAFVERSIAYERQGQYRASLIEMRNAIQADSDNIDYVVRYAELLTTVGSPNQAEELLKQRKDQIDLIRLPLTEALLRQGKYISALEYINGWKQNEAEQSEFDRLTALQSYLSGDQNAAFKAYRALSAKQDTPLETKQEFIALLLQSGQSSEAKQWTDQLLVDYPADPVLLYYDARVAYQSNNLEYAENQLTEALINLKKTDMLLDERLQVLELLSTVLTELGRSSEALVYSKLIREANPDAFLAKQQYKDALAAASTGDLTTAKAAFEDILNQFPNNQQAALLLGLINIEEGELETGEALLSENIDAEIAPVTIIRATALAQAEQGKPDEALAVLEKAILARPDDITLLSLYGVISLNNGQTQQGLQSISKALQLDPNRTRLHLLLAQYYVDQDRPDMALGYLRKAYKQNVQDWPTTGFYLTLLIREGETAEAGTVRNEIVNTYPDDTSALWIISMADYQLGNRQSSISQLVKLHKALPESINVINALAKLYQQENKYELAAGMWLKAIEVNPGNPTFVKSLVTNKLNTINTEELTDWLLKEAKRNPEIGLPLSAAAVELLVSQKRLAEAKAVAKPYLNLEQPQAKTIDANIKRGDALQAAEAQDWKLALKNAQEALEVIPNNVSLIMLVAQVQLRQDDVAGAIKTIDEAQQKKPNNARLINERTKILANYESPKAAFDYMTPFWDRSPNGALAQVYLGLVNTVAPDKMEITLNNLLENEPNNPGALTTLAGISMSKGDNTKAISLYEQAIKENANLVPALNNLAWLLKEQDINKALTYAKRGADLAPNSASVLDTYGWLLHLAGNDQDAIKVLDQALAIEPDNGEIKAHRDSI